MRGMFRRPLLLFIGIFLATHVSQAQEADSAQIIAARALVQLACDGTVSGDLREFKQRQINRRMAYLENTIAALKKDAASTGSEYTSEDQRDFEETLNRIQRELGVFQSLEVDGCPGNARQQADSRMANSNLIAANIRSVSATPHLFQLKPTSLQGTPQPGQPQKDKKDTTANSGSTPDAKQSPADAGQNATKPAADDVTKLKEQVKSIQDALSTDNQDFALVLGVGSMVINPHVSDYKNDSNILHTTNLGSSTPQLLTGVSFRSRVPGFARRFVDCASFKDATTGKVNPPAQKECGDVWQVHPWSGFVSLKFAPGASQLLNGYVIGGTYSITKYLNALIGFSMTPVNESSPGFRVTTSQFVTNQQKLGLDLNFNPSAMLLNRRNAFDGFPVTDASGKLLYQGDPLTVHYRAGAVFGVSFPIYFRSFLKPSTSGTN